MSTTDTEPKTSDSQTKLSRGVFTLVMLVVAAAAGGCYFAMTLR